jgi:hypothetical protein
MMERPKAARDESTGEAALSGMECVLNTLNGIEGLATRLKDGLFGPEPQAGERGSPPAAISPVFFHRLGELQSVQQQAANRVHVILEVVLERLGIPR